MLYRADSSTLSRKDLTTIGKEFRKIFVEITPKGNFTNSNSSETHKSTFEIALNERGHAFLNFSTKYEAIDYVLKVIL